MVPVTSSDRERIINLINEWDSAAEAANYRNELRQLARKYRFTRKDNGGYEHADVGRFVAHVFAQQSGPVGEPRRERLEDDGHVIEKPTMAPSGEDAKRVRGIVTIKYPPNDDLHQHDWANLVIDHGFHNEEVLERYGIREAHKAMNYIAMAATNPDVAEELPEDGVKFWRAVIHTFKAFMANKALGRE
jgi:hypothetical protein